LLEPESQNGTTVFVGTFNPAIFSPGWMALVGLIARNEVEECDVQLIHAELTLFRVRSFEIQVGPNRLAISSGEVPLVRVMDFALSLIGEHLPHTPVNAIGINFSEKFSTQNEAQRLHLGRRLAPLEPWGDWATALEREEPSAISGVKQITMYESKPDGREGHFSVTVEAPMDPSRPLGVDLASNDHFIVPESKNELPGLAAARLVEQNFERSRLKAFSIFARMRELALENSR
jgi:hypothetical protein